MKIENIKRRLLIKYPLFGSIIANAKFISTKEIETACTDGKDIYYNPDFVERLNKDEQTFLLAHEVCHIAFNHIFRSENKDPRLWNIATDAVINAYLQDDGLSVIANAINMPEAINCDAETMYNKLLEEQKNKEQEQQSQNNNSNEPNNDMTSRPNGQPNNQPNQNSQSNSNNSNQSSEQRNSDNNVGHDSHSMWSKAIEEKKKQEQSNQSEKSNQENDDQSNKIDETEIFKQNKIEKEQQLDELRKSLAKTSCGYGTSTNSEVRTVKDIGTSKPLIDWRRLLKEAVKYDVDWSYQNATIEDNVLTPHLEEQPHPETEILLDTSGSIEETLLRNFLRECKNIFKTSRVKVGCFDTKFYGFTEVKKASDIDNLTFKGGGGTDFNAAVNAFSRRVENKIIFTDGCARMPDKSIDAIWIAFGDIKINPKGGKVIYISQEQLNKLSIDTNNNYHRR